MAQEESPLSAVRINEIALLSSHFNILESPQEGDADIAVNVHTTETSLTNDAYETMAETRMNVILQHVSENHEDEPNMELSVEVVILASVDRVYTGVVGNAKEALRRESLSAGYDYVRSHIMYLTAMSPMGRFMIPAIDVTTMAE